METNVNNTAEGYFKSLKIIHLALLIGQCLFAAVAFFLVSTNQFPPTLKDSSVLKVIGAATALVGLGAGYFVAGKMVEAAQNNSVMDEKLNRYRSALLVRYALMEAPALLNVVLYMLTGGLLYLGIAGALIVWFGLQIPEKGKCLTEMSIDEMRLQEWEDGKL
jgi:hypothetical protein